MFKRDKVLHFSISLTMFAILIIAFPQLGLLWSVLISFSVGLVKEFVYDGLLGRGKMDYYDILANTVGISVGVGAYYAFQYI